MHANGPPLADVLYCAQCRYKGSRIFGVSITCCGGGGGCGWDWIGVAAGDGSGGVGGCG